MASRGCCVPTCNNSAKDGVSFYMIPRDVKLRKQWITNIARASKSRRWSPTGTSLKVCSIHFEGGRKTSDKNVPTIFNMQKNDAVLGPRPRLPTARQLARSKNAADAVAKRPPSPLVQIKKPPPPVRKAAVKRREITKNKEVKNKEVKGKEVKNKEVKEKEVKEKEVKEEEVKQEVKKELEVPAAEKQPAAKKNKKPPPKGKPAKKQRVRSQSASAKDEIKAEDDLISPVNMAPNVLARFIREDHLYCLPKSDSVSILQKLLEEKTRVVETLLERIHTLEMEVEEKDMKLNRLHEQLEYANARFQEHGNIVLGNHL